MPRKGFLAAGAILALAMTISGCSSSAGAGAQKTIKLGIVGDLTGAFADQFGGTNPQVDGINAAIDYVNAHGGVNGAKITTVTCDTQSNASRAQICAEQFISAKVLGVVGFSGSWSPTGVEDDAEAGILNFTYPNTEEELDGTLAFPLMGGGYNSYPAQAKYFTLDLGKKKAAIIYNAVPGSVELAPIYQQSIAEFGGKVVANIGVPASAADYTPYLATAQKAGAQVIYMIGAGPFAVSLIKAADSLGYDPRWALGDAAVEKYQMVQPLGAAANGTNGSSSTIEWTTPSNPQTKLFLEAMAKYQPTQKVFQNSATGFATLMTLVEVLKAMKGPITGPALTKFLENVSGIPVFMGGGAELNAKTAPKAHPHDLNPHYNIVQWQNSNQVIVATEVNGWQQ
jgi:branched-chain amino acid transport system substrate-binding protein